MSIRLDWERTEQELHALVSPAAIIRRGEPLGKRTTLRVGGPADLYVEPAHEADLAAVLRFCHARELPWFLLGRGSNLLIRDGGIRGVVLSLNQPGFAEVEVREGRLRVGAGARLKAVAAEAKRCELGGFEFLEGIPGSVGGALRMNAGAMGSWMFDVVESLRVVDGAGRGRDLTRAEVAVHYRECPLLRDQVAVSAVLTGRPTPRAEIEQRSRQFSEKRWATQPAAPSAGCIFKNPEAIAAGRLIDELGLKGTRVGDASVSSVHANFIVNSGQATARDVIELIELIRARARRERGIELCTEVEIVGEETPK